MLYIILIEIFMLIEVLTELFLEDSNVVEKYTYPCTYLGYNPKPDRIQCFRQFCYTETDVSDNSSCVR